MTTGTALARVAVVVLAGAASTSCSSDAPDDGAPATPAATTSGPASAVSIATATSPTAGPSSDGRPPSSTIAVDDQLCPPLEALASAVIASGELDVTRPWSELQADVVAVLGEAADRYAAILAVAPPDAADDVRVLVAYNDEQAAAAAAAPSLEEFQLALAAPDDDVNEATAVLNALAQDRCGVGLTID